MKLGVVLAAVLALVPCLASAEPGQGGPKAPPIDGLAEPVAPAVVSRDAAGHVAIRAIRLTQPLTLDGRLDDNLYHDNEAISDFVQQEPHEGAPATEKTEVWVAYDEDAFYVGARLWESDPTKRVTSDMRRDAANLATNNDHFAMLLDTFYDRRNGYIFLANSQGGITDGLVTNEGAATDFNTIWETKAADFEGGWTIEFRIPFRSIRFKEGGSLWGINFRRLARWKTETSFLTPVPASYTQAGLYKASSAATLVGIEPPRRLRNIDVKGYALGSTITNLAARPVILNKGDGEFGADVKWGITQNYLADLTYNTDFAQVEDDEQQVNLTRFSLFFPEKREFFMEGSQFFTFGIQGGTIAGENPAMFFSRRIGLENGGAVPIVAGGRLMGRSGPYRVGVLTMRTGDVPALNAVTTDFSVVRVQRAVLRRSRIGMMATRRAPSVGGSGNNYAYGADAMLLFFQNVQFVESLAQTKNPGRGDNDLSYRTRFMWLPDRWGVDIDQVYTGRDYVPEIGFLPRPDGFRRTHARGSFMPRPANMPSIRKFTYTADIDHFSEPTGPKVQSRDQTALFKIDYANGDVLQVDGVRTFEAVPAPFTVAKNVSIPPDTYHYTIVQASYRFGSQRKVSGAAATRWGTFYDGNLREVSWRGRVEFSPQLYAEPTVLWNRVDVPWGQGNSNLVSSRLTYTITPKVFVSALLQYQSRTDSLSTNARFRWEYRPGSEVFVVYSDGRTTLARGVPDVQNRSFVVKVTRLFQF